MSGDGFQVRAATAADIPLILALITELAEYEKLAHEVTASEEKLMASLFGDKACAEVLIAEAKTTAGPLTPAGFALYFQNYSTFLGQPGIYLEDLFVRTEFRRLGIGLGLLRELARITIARQCGRLDWMVLDWNESAMEFYRRSGARSVDGFSPYRVTGDALRRLAKDGTDN